MAGVSAQDLVPVSPQKCCGEVYRPVMSKDVIESKSVNEKH